MIKSLKSQSAHLMILFVIAIFMTFILLAALGLIYKEEPEECKNVNFQISETCKSDIVIGARISNLNSTSLNFITDKNDNVITIIAKQNNFIKFETTDDVTIIPVSNSFNNYELCTEKKQKIERELIVSRC